MKIPFASKTSLTPAVFALVVASCNTDKTTPGFTYMDDMYTSPSLETYGATDLHENGMASQLPVEGTVARGTVPYNLDNTNEGYLASLTNSEIIPENFASMDPDEGKELYNIFCGHCHGEKGDGIGILVEREKMLGVPGYSEERLPLITPSSAYHVLVYGRNMMGSHASQLDYEERWKVIRYVWKLRAEQSGKEDIGVAVPADTTTEVVVEANKEQA